MSSNETVALQDAFVAAVRGVDPRQADHCGARLLANYRELSVWSMPILEGTLLYDNQIPDDPVDMIGGWDGPGFELLEGAVTVERLAALEDGAAPLPDEQDLWRRRAAEWLLSEGDLDWDTYAGYAVRRVPASDGGVAYFAHICGGYSFTAVSDEYVGAGGTPEEALEQLKGRGYVSVDDFRARYSPPPVQPVSIRQLRRTRTKSNSRRAHDPETAKKLAQLRQAFEDAFPLPQEVIGGLLWLPAAPGGVQVPRLITAALSSVNPDEDLGESTLEEIGVTEEQLWLCGCTGQWGDPWWLSRIRLGERAYLVFQLPGESEWEHGGVLIGWSPAKSRSLEDQAIVHAHRAWGESLRFPFTASARSAGHQVEQMVNRPRFRRLAKQAAGLVPGAD
jgi:hypothetical protein